MRLKRNRIKTVYLFQAVTKHDNEGGTYSTYAEPVPLHAEIWAAGGQEQAQMYGQQLPNVRNFRFDGKYEEVTAENGKTAYRVIQDDTEATLTVNDGLALTETESPAYTIKAIYPYRWLQLEAVRNGNQS